MKAKYTVFRSTDGQDTIAVLPEGVDMPTARNMFKAILEGKQRKGFKRVSHDDMHMRLRNDTDNVVHDYFIRRVEGL